MCFLNLVKTGRVSSAIEYLEIFYCDLSSPKFQIIETDLDSIEKNADVQKARGIIAHIGC